MNKVELNERGVPQVTPKRVPRDKRTKSPVKSGSIVLEPDGKGGYRMRRAEGILPVVTLPARTKPGGNRAARRRRGRR